jgi:hypothetical protein
MMVEYADLEIGLHRRDASTHTVEFRFNQPGSETDIRIGPDQPLLLNLNLEGLARLANTPSAYSQKLTESFFANLAVQGAFSQALASAQSLHTPLRLRLMIGPSAPELHSLRWELLRHPGDKSLLSTSENLLFSRYLSSLDWRPVRLHARGDLSALVMVANPSDLGEYNLVPIDVEGEFERARTGLGDIPVSLLPESGGDQFATVQNLLDRLRDIQPDILYLVCHGRLVNDEPWLWFEGPDGNVIRISGSELVIGLKELVERPRLVVLASCQSAGDGLGETLAALGPRLAEAGIPAVIAMQGKISMETVAEFMPVFFRELSRDGQIDRAIAVARGAVRKRPDHWMPALYTRLKSGRIWYLPGFGDDHDEFEKWHSLVGSIQDKNCTPIIGPGLIETLLGSTRDVALRWARKHGYPMSPHDRDVLPRVAQYVLTHQSPAYISVAIREAARDEILRRYHSEMPDDLLQAKSWSTADFMRALKWVSDCCLSSDPGNPYRLLAKLRLPIYITSSTLDLLTNELIEAGADPVVRICPWNKWIPKDQAIYEETPSVERPLVYHLFGHMNVPNSIVYSEDRYFDYLIGVTLNKSLIPTAVRAALNSTSLLFLGFQMDDLEFRVFFRFLLAQEGREMLKFYSHVAAQIEPDEDRILDVKRARKYLEEYYESENIEIFWGSSKEFLKSLWQHM